jgi:predicted glycoside hydrolase/deacetylase ChbG (UPF0249 family)
VVNADDFGICARVNEGIVHAHRSGILTAASLMATGGAFEQAVRMSRELPGLDLGVHLCLVAGRPLQARGSSLVGPDGRLAAGAGEFARRYLGGRIRLGDVAAELCAQIERVLGHGVRVSHLDSHQHVHVLPGIAQLTQRLAARYRIPFVRRPLEGLPAAGALDRHGLRRLLGSAFLRASWCAARLAGASAGAGGALRFTGFQAGGRLDGKRLGEILRALRPGRAYELMCHPGLAPEDPEVRRWGYRHEAELAALTDPAIAAEIASRGIRLCRFTDFP